jgi:hypothetical protein
MHYKKLEIPTSAMSGRIYDKKRATETCGEFRSPTALEMGASHDFSPFSA